MQEKKTKHENPRKHKGKYRARTPHFCTPLVSACKCGHEGEKHKCRGRLKGYIPLTFAEI